MKTFTRSFLSTAMFTALLLLGPGCTDHFDELNVSPTAVQEDRIDENLLFTRSLVYGALRYTEFQRAQHLYANNYIQYYAVSVDRFETDRYITRNDWLTDYWTEAYADYGMQIQQVINISSRDPQKVNKTAMARIWKVFIMHRITDFWGDVPYFEAFQGNETPRYDSQETIYLDMLNELEEAVASFDSSASLSFGGADVLFGGSIDNWTRFGNALRFRLAMRLSNIAPQVAQEHIAALGTANLIANNNQSAVMNYGRDFGNADENVQPMGIIRSFNEYRASNTLVDFLRDNQDPRLSIYLEPNQNGEFVGLRNGLNPQEVNALNENDYSRDSNIISNLYAPSILFSFSEMLFLQAEAAQRGWIAGSPEVYYEQGIESSVNFWLDVTRSLEERSGDEFPDFSEIDGVTQAYLQQANIRYDASRGLEQIITQKWLANINQGFEAYADYRRTGFPILTPIPNTDGVSETGGSELPRRVRYPLEEQALNAQNYNEAVQRQGADLPTTRMWWDVP